MVVQWEILNQSHTVNVIKHSHQELKNKKLLRKIPANRKTKLLTHQLNYSPNGYDETAQ
jgi:hypothetical protein